jgi:branched-subunit amino acid ABC-type transport system permease component
MKPQFANSNDSQPPVEARLRTMRTLWIGMLLTVGAYYAFTLFQARSESLEPNNKLFLILITISLSTTLLSFLVKGQLLRRAIEQRQVAQVQQAYIIAWAVSEVAALLGILDFFATGDRYYYVMFIIAACGQLVNFPRREHVLNASFKSSL